MALFGIGNKPPKARTAAKQPALPAPSPESSLESVRLINDEYTPRMNVPAIALASTRRQNVALPATTSYASTQSSERRLIVGRDISLAGEISECDQLVVEGTIEAQVRRAKRLDISATGTFRGNANVDEADIAGHYEGELNATRLRLRGSAQFTGQLRFSFLEVEAGAQINGEVQHIAAANAQDDNAAIINFPPYQTAQGAQGVQGAQGIQDNQTARRA
jgi:cytoskeletal protein CcmA (bactofilin family)